MRRRRIRIPQRRRVFVGCEGESERGYVVLISRLLEERHRRVHLDPVLLGGGDPLAILETAVRRLHHRAERRAPYVAQAVFLDGDRFNLAPERTDRALRLAGERVLQLIWQKPCYEAFLLRHLPGCERLQPPVTQQAVTELRRRWPEYEKAMPAASLAMRVDRAAVLRAASVDEALQAFLEAIEFDGEAD